MARPQPKMLGLPVWNGSLFWFAYGRADLEFVLVYLVFLTQPRQSASQRSQPANPACLPAKGRGSLTFIADLEVDLRANAAKQAMSSLVGFVDV